MPQIVVFRPFFLENLNLHFAALTILGYLQRCGQLIAMGSYPIGRGQAGACAGAHGMMARSLPLICLRAFSSDGEKPFIPPKQLRLWTPDEDDRLRAGVEKHGFKWSVISSTLLPERTGTSCRTRWLNSLNPDIKAGSWSAEVSAVCLLRC